MKDRFPENLMTKKNTPAATPNGLRDSCAETSVLVRRDLDDNFMDLPW